MEFNCRSWKPFLSSPSFSCIHQEGNLNSRLLSGILRLQGCSIWAFAQCFKEAFRDNKIKWVHHCTKCLQALTASLDPHQPYRVWRFYSTEVREVNTSFILFQKLNLRKRGRKGGKRNQITQKGFSAVNHLNEMEPEMNRHKVCFPPRYWEFVWPWHYNLPTCKSVSCLRNIYTLVPKTEKKKQENPSHTTCTSHKMTQSKQSHVTIKE